MPGLDRSVLTRLNFDLANSRIQDDIRSDFIFAPHFQFIFDRAANDLQTQVRSLLASGQFELQQPITVNVPKPSHLFRPGSILYPQDRLIYQAIADEMAPAIEGSIDRTRVFSNVYNPIGHSMFQDTNECYSQFMAAVTQNARLIPWAIKTDISTFFESINQHTLIAALRYTTNENELCSFLENSLSVWHEISSRGILQGMYPSDLFGNFYLSALDLQLRLGGYTYFRFVDDLNLFFPTEPAAFRALDFLSENARRLSLSLNEYKTHITESPALIRQETEFDSMLENFRESLAARAARRSNSSLSCALNNSISFRCSAFRFLRRARFSTRASLSTAMKRWKRSRPIGQCSRSRSICPL